MLKSIEDSLPGFSSFQRKQYECIMAHLKDDKSVNVQVVQVGAGSDFDGIGVEDQSVLYPPPSKDQGMSMIGACCLAYPLSRGSIHIESSNPGQQPRIDPALLSQ